MNYDFETKSLYQLTVEVTDGYYGGTVTSDIEIHLIDVDEPPSAPDAPTVSPVSGSTSSLSVAWTAPDNTGKPDIESYDLQYRKGTSGLFTDGPQDVADTMAIIDGLDANASYEVQVRATNDEGDGLWSSAGTGSTSADTTPPTINSVTPVSDPGADDTYGLGDTITVAVEFTAAVIVTGTPQITLRVGGGAAVNQKLANYASGSGTPTLRFSYVVQAADMDDNGIYIEADELVLNGGTIQNTSGTDATLTYAAPGTQAEHKVDGSITADTTPPALGIAEVTVDGTHILLIFNEGLDISGYSAITVSDFGVTADGNSVTVGSLRTTVEFGEIDAITLVDLSPAITHGQVVTVSYADPTTGDDTAGVLEDAAGNDVASFTTGSGGVPAVVNNVPVPWSVTVDPSEIPEDGGVSTVTVSTGGATFTDRKTITLEFSGSAVTSAGGGPTSRLDDGRSLASATLSIVSYDAHLEVAR